MAVQFLTGTYLHNNIEKHSETKLWELCENFARTLTFFYRGTVDFRF